MRTIYCHGCLKEYEETEVDWSTIPVDTPIYVSHGGEQWHHRHFAKFDGKEVYAWEDGTTSWSTAKSDDPIGWSYARLAADVAQRIMDQR